MTTRRPIKTDENNVILYLLQKLALNPEDYPINQLVDEYEGYVMGSIGIGNPEISPYAGDLIQAQYTDVDGVKVVITLTKDANGQLLDLDFWKEDFSKLLQYPKPEDLQFV